MESSPGRPLGSGYPQWRPPRPSRSCGVSRGRARTTFRGRPRSGIELSPASCTVAETFAAACPVSRPSGGHGGWVDEFGGAHVSRNCKNSAATVVTVSDGAPPIEDLTQEDTHYSHTVSTVLQHQSTRWSASPASAYVAYSNQSAFTSWITTRSDHGISAVDGTSQWLLKYILFSVPFLHTKYREDAASPKSQNCAAESASRFRKGTPQDELSANHVLAERRRREKLNERFIILRSLVPFVTKMDKASILGDTIEYVKQLRKKIQDLEARTRQMEVDQRSRSVGDAQKTSDKRKMRIVEGGVGGKPKPVEQPPPPPPPAAKPMEVVAVAGDVLQVEVSIIESDALVELQCPYKEGLLLDVMQKLRELRVEITAVQSSLNNGVFAAEMRAKVKENINGKKLSIVEVKRAINQIIHQH
ncbi:hypothetical protein RJ639_043114 [Escallonia herrerae]|uniref:BHLH domain-containing protein n=1 Tax=Escallonia herrerae TaxID=1293975 RepID=A0AA89AZJ4_9ASTE|nr:hypothetical protein RJ639_043114 [Escallonia herrerae]